MVPEVQNIGLATMTVETTVMIQLGMIVSGMVLIVMKNQKMKTTLKINTKTLKTGLCAFKRHGLNVVPDIQNIMLATLAMGTVMIQIGMIVFGMALVVMKNQKMNTREVSRVATWTVTLMQSAIQWVQNQKRWIHSSFS